MQRKNPARFGKSQKPSKFQPAKDRGASRGPATRGTTPHGPIIRGPAGRNGSSVKRDFASQDSRPFSTSKPFGKLPPFEKSASTSASTRFAGPKRFGAAKKKPVEKAVPEKTLHTDGSERINVHLRNTGKVTRREADELIEAGKVLINGIKATLGARVLPTDKVEIRGKGKEYRYFLYNKPAGVVSSTPQKDEKEIADTAKFPLRVFPIGRLDKDSTGLIIMTNDGRITDSLLSPDREHEKEYVVGVDRMLSQDFKKKMENGIKISSDEKSNHKVEEYTTKPCKVKLTGDKTFSIVLTEGKNRQIRRMCESLGYKVVKLERIRIGKFMIGKLKPNEWREVKM